VYSIIFFICIDLPKPNIKFVFIDRVKLIYETNNLKVVPEVRLSDTSSNITKSQLFFKEHF